MNRLVAIVLLIFMFVYITGCEDAPVMVEVEIVNHNIITTVVEGKAVKKYRLVVKNGEELYTIEVKPKIVMEVLIPSFEKQFPVGDKLTVDVEELSPYDEEIKDEEVGER